MTLAQKNKTMGVIRYIVLILVAIMMLYPLFWLVGGVWKGNSEIFTSAWIFPMKPVDGWKALVQGWITRTPLNLGQYFLNTLRFLLPRVIFQTASCLLTAYAVSRFKFVGKKIVFSLIIATLLMPDVVFRIPLFILWRDFDMLNTVFPLWLDSAFATGSFFVFMLIQFMRTIPKDLDEAAKIDGCGSFKILYMIIVPCMKPAIITVSLLTFMWGMNDFLGPLIYITDPLQYPLSLGLRLASDNTGAGVQFNEVFAMSALALIPAVVLFFAAQRYFIDGIAATGSKE